MIGKKTDDAKIEAPKTEAPVAEAPQAESTEAAAAKKRELVVVSPERLKKLLQYHTWSAMAVGLIPLPMVDFAGVTAIQLNLIRKLAQEYQIKFFKGTVKNVLSAMVGALIPASASGRVAASLTKFIPGIGQTVGVITMPILSGATTYAVGKVFIQHFAAGGTILTFDPEKVKSFYEEALKEGYEVAKDLKNDLTASNDQK